MNSEVFSNLTGINVTSYVDVGKARNVASWHSIVTGVLLSPIIFLGVIGNLFSLLVWIKGRRRKTSTARYLSALAVADILVLVVCAVEFWIGYVLEIDVRAEGTGLCKFFFYMSFLASALSAWILVCVTVERALSVWIPHRINVACTQVTALCIIGVTAFILIAVYLPLMTGSGVVTVTAGGSSYVVCSILPSALIRGYYFVWLILDLCLFFAVPFIVMLVCNISILTKVVCLAKKRRCSLQAGVRTQTAPSSSKTKKMLRTVTRRVVLLSITFCICNAPISVLNVILISSQATNILPEEHVETYRVIFNILMFLNNGVNFLLYCMIGSGFRKDFVSIFKSGSRTSTT